MHCLFHISCRESSNTSSMIKNKIMKTIKNAPADVIGSTRADRKNWPQIKAILLPFLPQNIYFFSCIRQLNTIVLSKKKDFPLLHKGVLIILPCELLPSVNVRLTVMYHYILLAYLHLCSSYKNTSAYITLLKPYSPTCFYADIPTLILQVRIFSPLHPSMVVLIFQPSLLPLSI